MNTLHDMHAILGDDFFKEQVRCDYLVSEKMKKIWAVEMDMYLAFAEVCEKYGLKYFFDGGSLLGAVRHNGFIPWDDDIDIIMPREDYNEFMKLSSEFNDPIFLQTPYTDPGYYVSWIKLRNSKTSGISKSAFFEPYNQGLFLDIFPLDYYFQEDYDSNREKIYEHIMRCSSAMKKHSYDFLTEEQKLNCQLYQSDDPLQDWEAIQSIASNPKYKTSDKVSNIVTLIYKPSALFWKSEWYRDSVSHKFESIEVPIPIGWDERLRAQYGDYMKLPSKDNRGVWHENVIFDPEKSYLEYIKK